MAVEVAPQSKPPAPPESRPVDDHARKPSLWRRICVAVLLILGFVLTPVAVLVTYTKTQVLDTDRYVATVKPLASDPAVQNYIADEVTANLLAQVDVKGYVTDVVTALQSAPAVQALPQQGQRLQGLAGPITTSIENFVHQAVLRIVQSSQFQRIWETANRGVHAQMVKVLTNEGAAVSVERNGAVKLDLKGIAGLVQQRLDEAGFTLADKIPVDKVSGSIVLFQSEELYKARRGAQVLNNIGYALPFIVLACFGGAILLSARKRRAFIKAAVAFALGAVVLALLVNGARHLYLHALSKDVPQAAAAAIYDNLLRSLHTSVRNILFVALVIAAVAWVSGPARPAVAFRGWWARSMAWAGGDADHGMRSANAWVSGNKRLLRILLAIVVFLLAFRWPHPTTAVLFWLAVLGIVGLVIIDFYGRGSDSARQSPAGGGAAPGEA